MEIVNIGASFPAAVDQAIREGLKAHEDFEAILAQTSENISEQVFRLGEAYSRLLIPPAPYYSIFMHGCLEWGRDLSEGLKYNNFGIHGACAANAADALAAAKQFVFEEASITADELFSALEANFEGYESLRRKLAEEAPKVG
jgi:formate C-acetyltransferase